MIAGSTLVSGPPGGAEPTRSARSIAVRLDHGGGRGTARAHSASATHDSPAAILAELAEHTLISLSPGTGPRASLDQAYAAQGIQPRIAVEAIDPELLARALISQGRAGHVLGRVL